MMSTAAPLVTVIVPCFNQGRFLAEAIESALGQTHSPIEVIVVDDGSTDETAQVAASYATVGCVTQANAGAPRARNRGLRDARGELVLFLDADDRLVPDAIERGVAALEAHPDWAFASGHVRLISSDGAVECVPPQEHADGDQFVALLRSNYIWTPGAVLYRRAVLERVGSFDPAARASADYELNLRIARQYPIGCHHQIVLEYRRHHANMSGDAGEMLRSAVAVRRAQRRFAAGNPVTERAWREGIEIVRADFGERLLSEVAHDLRAPGRRMKGFIGAVRLARYYPAGLVRRLSGAAASPASL